MEILRQVFQTPFIWQSLGMITAISLFISPILYNGDYKLAIKSLIIISGYAIFSSMLIILHSTLNLPNIHCWVSPIIFLILVAMSYTLGLFLGIYIHKKVKKD